MNEPAASSEGIAAARRLIDRLLRASCYPHPVADIRLLETHISWVVLTGDFAYKIKKPVKFDFVDFSTLSRRRHYCAEELRLNRRTAPKLYLDVVPITGAVDRPRIGGAGEPLEFAVKMRQFADAARLDHRIAHGDLAIAHLRAFGEQLAQFHAAAELDASPDELAAALLARMQRTGAKLADTLRGELSVRLGAALAWYRDEIDRRRARLEMRAIEGRFRECHGDLHLGNLVWLDGAIVAFDCIEFDSAMRRIDAMADVAFLTMDLQVRGRSDLAYAFADAYLAATGDYSAMAMLPLFEAYCSLVRARVATLSRSAADKAAADVELTAKIRRHIEFVERSGTKRKPVLVLMSGLSASGKSSVAELLVPRIEAVRVRSDLERKRSAGISPLARSRSPVGGGLYDSRTSRTTYARLAALAADLLDGGHSVIVDAAMLRRAQRRPFYALAARRGVRCVVLECSAPLAVLERRIAERAPGVSEADSSVLQYQLRRRESFGPPDGVAHIEIDTTRALDLNELTRRLLG